jgi:hypothetical protein
MLKKLEAFCETQQRNHFMISIKTSSGFFPDFSQKSPDQLLFLRKTPGFLNVDLAALVLTKVMKYF